jgi:hypothetical protein
MASHNFCRNSCFLTTIFFFAEIEWSFSVIVVCPSDPDFYRESKEKILWQENKEYMITKAKGKGGGTYRGRRKRRAPASYPLEKCVL